MPPSFYFSILQAVLAFLLLPNRMWPMLSCIRLPQCPCPPHYCPCPTPATYAGPCIRPCLLFIRRTVAVCSFFPYIDNIDYHSKAGTIDSNRGKESLQTFPLLVYIGYNRFRLSQINFLSPLKSVRAGDSTILWLALNYHSYMSSYANWISSTSGALCMEGAP